MGSVLRVPSPVAIDTTSAAGGGLGKRSGNLAGSVVGRPGCLL